MYGLVKELYSEQKQRAFEDLYNDSDARLQLLMRSAIAEAMKDCPRLLTSNGSDWILCTLSSYHKPSDDTMRVFQGIMRKFDSISFGLLTDRIQFRETNDLADTCLVGLSFFRKHIIEWHRRKAAPSMEYYERAGALAFRRIGFDDIGQDFRGWVQFIEREFVDTTIL